MDNTLICCVDLFSKTQVLVTPDGEKLTIYLPEESQQVLQYCASHNISKIHFFGSEILISQFIDIFVNNDNITVEVN